MHLGALTGSGETASVTGFAIDHRKVAPGTVFGAFRGTRFNGEDFIADAVVARRRGGRRPAPRRRSRARSISPTAEPRRAFARLAAKFFAPFPETMVAVTGTNGKTSNVELVRQLWRMAGPSVGEHRHARRHHRRRAGEDRADHAGHRHLPVQHGRAGADGHHPCRLRGVEPRPRRNIAPRGCRCGAAAFTNFTRDHLDYHVTMEAYFEAKMRLFEDVLEPDGDGGGLDRRSEVRRGDRALRGAGAEGADRRQPRRDAEAGRSASRPSSARS